MKTTIKCILLLTVLSIFSACSKSDFLDKKPSTAIVTPSTLTDLEHMLDNTSTIQYTPGLAQLGDDDYYVPNEEELAPLSATQRNSYIWDKDLYAGASEIPDWNVPYRSVFYCNSVLDVLDKLDSSSTTKGEYLRGWALFNRAYAFYDLTRNFCKAYNSSTAATDLGIPLRLKSGINSIEPRASLEKTLEQIIKDLDVAESILPAARPAMNLNRPSKIAVYALKARIYLDMQKYEDAESNAVKCLELYSALIDYNTLDPSKGLPFSSTHEELIYNICTVPAYDLGASLYTPARIAPDLINSYSADDLRLIIFFQRNDDGTYVKKGGYYGDGFYPFTGLATDEMYLVKAECLARRNEIERALETLNDLVIKRYDKNKTYVKITANNRNEALEIILTERRKELTFRCLRWHDLKRLNMSGANVTLTRSLHGKTYSLPPNDPRWVFPIPNDEINLSGIQQNQR